MKTTQMQKMALPNMKNDSSNSACRIALISIGRCLRFGNKLFPEPIVMNFLPGANDASRLKINKFQKKIFTEIFFVEFVEYDSRVVSDSNDAPPRLTRIAKKIFTEIFTTRAISFDSRVYFPLLYNDEKKIFTDIFMRAIDVADIFLAYRASENFP